MKDIISWEDCLGATLPQREYLEECPVELVTDISKSTNELDAKIEKRNLLVMTQSCDLAQNKAKSVAL